MNWVKTRLSVREDKLRMKQREFFANKKQTQMIQTHQPGSGRSLDLQAVAISNQDKFKAENQPQPKIVKVDLDKLNPYRQRVRNVDLGPLSPTKCPLVLRPTQRRVVSDISPMTWQPSSLLSASHHPIPPAPSSFPTGELLPPASRSARRDILPPLMPQTKFQQTTRQNENSRSKTKFEEKAQLILSDSVRSEPETPFIPFSKPGPRVTFNNKTETWSYSCSSSSSENSSKEKSRSSAIEFPSSLHPTTTQSRYHRNLFETEDFQDVSECRATENWQCLKGRRNEKHSTNTLSDFEVVKERSCLGENYHFRNDGSSYPTRGRSAESENSRRFLPTLKSKMSKIEGNLTSVTEEDVSAEHVRKYSDSQNGKPVDLCDDGRMSGHTSDASANYASSHEMRRKLELDGKDLVECWISRNNDTSTQRSFGPESRSKERGTSQQDFLSESPFGQSSDYTCNRRTEAELGRKDLNDWVIREKSAKEEVLKANEPILEVESARRPLHREERKLQSSPGARNRWSKSVVIDTSNTEQRRSMSLQSLHVDYSAKSFTQETKDSMCSDSPSQFSTDSSSDEEEEEGSSILSSCPSTKSFIESRSGHQRHSNCWNNAAAGGNGLKDCNVGVEEQRAAQNGWLSFVRGETQAPVTGSRQLPAAAAAAAQVVAEHRLSIAGNEVLCSESNTKSCKTGSGKITLSSDVSNKSSTQSTPAKEIDNNSLKSEMAEENANNYLQMVTPTHVDRSSCTRLVTPPEPGDNNNFIQIATARLLTTDCFNDQNVTRESPETIGVAVPGAAVHESDEAVHSATYLREESNFGIRNTTKCVNNSDHMMVSEVCIMDDDIRPTANVLHNDETFPAGIEPPPKRYRFFRELVIGDSSSLSINCESPTISEGPVSTTTSNVQTSCSDVFLSPCVHLSHSSAALVTAGTQTSPISCPTLAVDACTSPEVNRWTVDAQSSPMFGHLQPSFQSYTSLNCHAVDVSLSPVFKPMKCSNAQLSPNSSFSSANAQQLSLQAENPKSSTIQECFASDMPQSLYASSETTSNLQTHSSIPCDNPLLPACAEVNIESMHSSEYSVQIPLVAQEMCKSNICLDMLTNEQDYIPHDVNVRLEDVGYGAVEEATSVDGKPQMITEGLTPRLTSDDQSLSNISDIISMVGLCQHKENEVDKTDCFGHILQAACNETSSPSGGSQSNISFIENKALDDQCNEATMAEERSVGNLFEVDELSAEKLKDSVSSENSNIGVNCPDVVHFSSGLEDLSFASVDMKMPHSLDSPDSSNSVYSSPVG